MSCVLLSPEEVKELKDWCSRQNLELGMNIGPEHLKCFRKRVATSSSSVVLKFKEHEAADKWNNMHENRIRKLGHIGTLGLGLIGYIFKANPAVSGVAITSAAIAKDEIQARTGYPEMHKGWTLVRSYSFRCEQFPHQHFHMEWSDLIKDENGKVVERRNHTQSYAQVGGPSGIPEELIRNIMTRLPQHKTLVFQ